MPLHFRETFSSQSRSAYHILNTSFRFPINFSSNPRPADLVRDEQNIDPESQNLVGEAANNSDENALHPVQEDEDEPDEAEE